jgi:hypothetical protein
MTWCRRNMIIWINHDGSGWNGASNMVMKMRFMRGAFLELIYTFGGSREDDTEAEHG